MIELFAGSNTHYIEVTGLTKEPAGDSVDTATVEARVMDTNENVVTNTADPITLTADVSTDGRYEGTIPADAEINAGTIYIVEITADDGSVEAEWEEKVLAEDRDLSN